MASEPFFKDSPAELADAIVRLLTHLALRLKLGRVARQRAEQHFYEGRLAEEVQMVYRRVGVTPQSS